MEVATGRISLVQGAQALRMKRKMEHRHTHHTQQPAKQAMCDVFHHHSIQNQYKWAVGRPSRTGMTVITVLASSLSHVDEILQISEEWAPLEGVGKRVLLSEGPWTGSDLLPAWELYFQKQGLAPHARCISEECPACLLYTSPSPRDRQKSRMPSSA